MTPSPSRRRGFIRLPRVLEQANSGGSGNVTRVQLGGKHLRVVDRGRNSFHPRLDLDGKQLRIEPGLLEISSLHPKRLLPRRPLADGVLKIVATGEKEEFLTATPPRVDIFLQSREKLRCRLSERWQRSRALPHRRDACTAPQMRRHRSPESSGAEAAPRPSVRRGRVCWRQRER